MGMEEKHFPGWYVDKNPKALFEENRICFVCISRAKRFVSLCILIIMTSMIIDMIRYVAKDIIHLGI